MSLPPPPEEVSICVCTFRRPHLRETLQSLALIELSESYLITIIVADNDEQPSAKSLVEDIAVNFPYKINYIHAPARNISIARNACLEAASGKFVAFIDDDEIASTQWLDELLLQQKSSNADVVLGPAHSIYPTSSPNWIKEGDFHSIKPVWVNGHIITGYTANVLFLRSSPSIQNRRFHLELGRSGGEDTTFFSEVHKAGGFISYAENAVVTEIVAPERLTFMWLAKRFFRSGQTHGAILLADNDKSIYIRLLPLTIACSKALFCGLVAAGSTLANKQARYWALRGILHLGVVARLIGTKELKQYG